jgi:excisionase family DNA binding protein
MGGRVTLDESIAATVEAAVARAVEPLRREMAELRRAQEAGAMTVAEAARRLGVSPRTVQRQVAAGKIPALRLGRTVRIPVDAVLGPAHGTPNLGPG